MSGYCRAFAVFLGTLVACGCGNAFAADPLLRPLQLKLGNDQPTAHPADRGSAPANAHAEKNRREQARLGERARTALLDGAERQETMSPAAAPGANFRFSRRGNVGRDLGQGYDKMCDAVSRKVWDDPKGKRIRFDVAGKPGVGIEIPLR